MACRLDLARADLYKANFAEALAILDDLARRYQEKFGPTDRRTLVVMHDQAETYRWAGQFPRSAALHEEVLRSGAIGWDRRTPIRWRAWATRR